MTGFLGGGSGNGKDLFARDQLALTNLRLMLQTGVASGSLLAGYQWEFSSDEWGATSSGEAYVAGPPGYYHNSGTSGRIANATPFGNMASGQGLAAAFDQSVSTAAIRIASTGYVGMAWPVQHWATEITVKSKSTASYTGNNGGTVTLNIYGSNTAPASGTDGTLLYYGALTNTSNNVTTINAASGLNVSTPYLYHWAYMVASVSEVWLAELDFSETIYYDMTLQPASGISLASVPDFAAVYFLWKEETSGVVFQSDLIVEVSRDGGTTWAAASDIEIIASYDASYTILASRVDLTALPSGSSLLPRVKGLNNKSQRVAALAAYVE